MAATASNLPPRRRWFRLSLRTLMVLVIPLMAGLSWLAHSIQLQRESIAAVRAAGGTVIYDYQTQEVGPPGPTGPTYRTEPSAPGWVRRWLGDELFQSVVAVELPYLETPAILAAVARFDHLDRLRLASVSTGGLGPGSLAGLRQLRVLELEGGGLQDEALAEVATLRSLHTLQIDSTSASDAGFAHLVVLPAVRDLKIRHNGHLSDAGLGRTLAGMPALRNLEVTLEMGPVAATAAAIGHHLSLETLTIGRIATMTAADCEPIGRLTRLRVLRMPQCPVTDAGLAHLRQLKGLIQLDLTGSRVTGAGLVDLGKLTTLEELDLTSAPLGPEADLTPLTHLPHLQTLSLESTGVSDAAVKGLVRTARLSQLTLSHNLAITDRTLQALASCPNLQTLDVNYSGVTIEGVQTLRTARPQLATHFWNGYRPQVATVPNGQ